MPDNAPESKPTDATKPAADTTKQKMPEKLLSSFVRPAFRSLDIKGDRGMRTKAVEDDSVLPEVKVPGEPAKPFDPAKNVGFGPTAPRAGVKPVRRPVQTRLPSQSAAALRSDPNHVPEPHLHRRKSGGYIGLFLVLFVCIAFGAYTFGDLPLDQLFDQGNAAVQSHNDQLVNFIIHRLLPILGLALGGLIIITALRRLVGSKEIK